MAIAKMAKMDCWVKNLQELGKFKSNRSNVSNAPQNHVKLILGTTGSHFGKV